MNNFRFWDSFSKEHKRIYLVLAGILVLSLTYMVIYWALGVNTIIGWNSMLFTESVSNLLDTVQAYPFNMDIEVESVAFTEYFSGSAFTIKPIIGYIYLIFFALSWIVLITITSYLSRFWYYFSAAMIIVLVILMKLDLLLIFGSAWNGTTILVLAGYLGFSYYFRSFKPESPLLNRLLTFTGITGIISILIFYFSKVENPFFYVVSYSLPVSIIFTIFMVLLVSHEVIALFMRFTSGTSKASSSSWKHFYLISIIYLINVLLIYLNEIHAINWKLLPISTVLLFLVSFILGIWEFKHRENQYDYLVPFRPLGALFYLAMGIVSFATIGFLSGNSNDPGLEVIEDFIIYSQLGYGFIFLMYVASNFINPLSKGMAVYKILYRPQTMPYFTYRLAGTITFLALVFMESWDVPVQQATSAYYNSLGDLYFYNKDEIPAQGYYRKGMMYSYNNHRSNYALAQIAINNEEPEVALECYERAVKTRPTPFSFVNLSNMYFNQNRFFDAMFLLRKGLKEYPHEGHILNNMALLHSRSQSYDSAIYYLNLAMESGEGESVALGNLPTVLMLSGIETEIDSLGYESDGNFVFENNKLAYYNYLQKGILEPIDLRDTVLNEVLGMYSYNYLINSLYREDTLGFDVIKSVNVGTMENKRKLELGLALNYYYKGRINEAFRLMKSISSGEPGWAVMINGILGKWYFEQGEMKIAASYFKTAAENYDEYSKLYQAIALSQGGNRQEALTIWEELIASGNLVLQKTAQKVMNILAVEDLDNVKLFDDAEKYQWLIFNDFSGYETLTNGFNDPNYSAMAKLERLEDAYLRDQIEFAEQFMDFPERPELNEVVLKKIDFWETKLTAIGDDFDLIKKLSNESITDRGLSLFIQAKKLLISGDSSTFSSLISNMEISPFNEELVVLASRFYLKKGKTETSYSIILDAITQNPNSIALKKYYVWYCGQTGNIIFGQSMLADLEADLPSYEYNQLKDEFEKAILEWESYEVN